MDSTAYEESAQGNVHYILFNFLQIHSFVMRFWISDYILLLSIVNDTHRDISFQLLLEYVKFHFLFRMKIVNILNLTDFNRSRANFNLKEKCF